MNTSLLTFLFVSLGALLGFSWGHDHAAFAIVFAVAFPVALFFAPTRFAGFLYSLAYFLAASRGIPHGVGVFFDTSASPIFGWGLWVGAACLNAAPWAWAWTKRVSDAAIFRVLVAVVVTALPPIGIVGWASPLASAGWLFPGIGFFGLILLFWFWHSLIQKEGEFIVGLALVCLMLNGYELATPKEPSLNGLAFENVDTNFSKLQSNAPDYLSSRVVLITRTANQSAPNSVTVLPETMLPAPDSRLFFVEVLLENASEVLREKNSVIIFGREYKTETGMINTLAFLGVDRAPLKQRIPVPFGMWKPWASDSFEMNIFGPGSTNFAGLKLGHLVCFEEVLTITNLMTFAKNPDVVVSSANDWWAKDTSIPAVQAQTVGSWGRLFGAPVVRAVNF